MAHMQAELGKLDTRATGVWGGVDFRRRCGDSGGGEFDIPMGGLCLFYWGLA